MFNARLSHEEALERIGRYLKATRDKGLVLNPSGQLKVDAYPDADFAGLYGHKKVTNLACAKSRMGFLLTVSDCPMVWVSKLQTETALSTIEAKIIALAHCCWEQSKSLEDQHDCTARQRVVKSREVEKHLEHS